MCFSDMHQITTVSMSLRFICSVVCFGDISANCVFPIFHRAILKYPFISDISQNKGVFLMCIRIHVFRMTSESHVLWCVFEISQQSTFCRSFYEVLQNICSLARYPGTNLVFLYVSAHTCFEIPQHHLICCVFLGCLSKAKYQSMNEIIGNKLVFPICLRIHACRVTLEYYVLF